MSRIGRGTIEPTPVKLPDGLRQRLETVSGLHFDDAVWQKITLAIQVAAASFKYIKESVPRNIVERELAEVKDAYDRLSSSFLNMREPSRFLVLSAFDGVKRASLQRTMRGARDRSSLCLNACDAALQLQDISKWVGQSLEFSLAQLDNIEIKDRPTSCVPLLVWHLALPFELAGGRATVSKDPSTTEGGGRFVRFIGEINNALPTDIAYHPRRKSDGSSQTTEGTPLIDIVARTLEKMHAKGRVQRRTRRRGRSLPGIGKMVPLPGIEEVD